MTASLTRFASHRSASDASGAAPRACRSSKSTLAASSSSPTRSVEGETISRKCARRPVYVFWSYRVPEGSKGGVEEAIDEQAEDGRVARSGCCNFGVGAGRGFLGARAQLQIDR
eukprot:scaffold44988_cov67-Phaeocystis_antarctica.AAC.3